MQKTTDCIFIFAPCADSKDGCFDYHLGSAYIISYLNSKGFNARQYIHKDPIRLKTCIREILASKPRVAGFTVYNTNFGISALIAEEIRKSSPQTVIVFGGPCASVHSGYIMNSCSFVDACFINEAEETFLEFIKKLSAADFRFSGADLSGIPGITYRQSGGIFENRKNSTVRNHSKSSNYLDKYPSPYLNGIIPATEASITGLITARGCNQNCVYCTCAVLSDRRFSTHSTERVVSELDYISHHSDNHQVLTFQDDTFTLIPERAAEICRSIIQNRIDVRLECITRCDCIDEALLDLMKEAGFVSLTFSLESADPEILRRIGKVHRAEDIPSDNLDKERRFIESFTRMAAYAKKIGFRRIATSIMSGLPGETLNQANRTVEFVHSDKNIDQYAHNFLKIFKGTPLSGYYEKYGYRIRYINNNPVYLRMHYPVNFAGKVFISPKSHLHSQKRINDTNTLSILALSAGQGSSTTGFRNIILQSDHVSEKLVRWLKEILSINGAIIQIYSSEKAMTRLSDRNYAKLIKYSSPSLNVRNYFPGEEKDAMLLLSSESVQLKSYDESENIRLCDFEYFRSRQDDTGASFMKTLCRESVYSDSVSAHSFLLGICGEKDPFSFLVRKKALPYFSGICKWTRDNANCINRSTLIINDRNEARFCWHGNKAGCIGFSYEDLVSNLEAEMQKSGRNRKCDKCEVQGDCIKCPFPFPLPEAEYCLARRTKDVCRAAELINGLDQIKKILS